VGTARTGRLEGETLPVSDEVFILSSMQPTGSQGCALGIEGRQPPCDFVRIDEFAYIEFLRQQSAAAVVLPRRWARRE